MLIGNLRSLTRFPKMLHKFSTSKNFNWLDSPFIPRAKVPQYFLVYQQISQNFSQPPNTEEVYSQKFFSAEEPSSNQQKYSENAQTSPVASDSNQLGEKKNSQEVRKISKKRFLVATRRLNKK